MGFAKHNLMECLNKLIRLCSKNISWVDMSKQSTNTKMTKVSNGSFKSLFMHADDVDMFLMAVGLLSAIGDGLATPIMFFITSTIMNSIGGSSSSAADVYTDKINKVNTTYIYIFVYIKLNYIDYCWKSDYVMIYILFTECCISLLLVYWKMVCVFPR